MIKKAKWKNPVLACDKVLIDCLKHNIKPYAVCSVDGSPQIANFYTHNLVRKNAKDFAAVLSVTVHPKVVEAWKGKTFWFTPMLDMPGIKGTTKINSRSPTFILHVLSNYKGIASGIGNVGSFLFNVGFILECSDLILVGFDFSEQVKDKADAVYFNAFVRMILQKIKDRPVTKEDFENAMDQAAALHQVERNPDFNTYYLVNPIWKRYRETLAAHIITSKKHVINATQGGCLHTEAIKAPNFEAMSLEDALRKYG